MRKLLLAGVAGLGVWGAATSDAFAQTSTSSQQGAVFTPYTGGAGLPTASAPVPGSVTVRLNGRVRFYAYYAGQSDFNNNAAGTATQTENVAGQGTATGEYKLGNYGFAEFGRLYPGFDGIAANGLKYGANLEIRQDQNSGAGGGTYGGISQQDRARGDLYFRRVWGYLGTDQIGTFRFGSTDQPTSLYLTGNFENFNDGGLNGDVPTLILSAGEITWPFSDVGNYYTTNKVVYLSPSFFGFDGGVSFEPSTANVNINSGCNDGGYVSTNFTNPAGTGTVASGASSNGASAGCDTLAASPNNAESGRRKNTFDVLLRYRGSFGPVGVAATAAYIGGSHVLDNQTGVPFNANPLNGTVRYNYGGLDIGDFGATATYAGFSFGGHYMHGRFNNQWALDPRGLAAGDAGLIGASYTYGPLIVGAHWLSYTHAGDMANAAFGRIQREQGLGYGGTYSLAPGVSIFLSGLYMERAQNGYNFVTGQTVGSVGSLPGSAGNPNNNKITTNLIALGTAFSW